MEKEIRELKSDEIENVSGGSIERTGDGKYRVFNSFTGESLGIYDTHEEAINAADENKLPN